MMRIIIEIDGDNVSVHTDGQLSETNTAKAVDAGSAPVELLREHGFEGIHEALGPARSPRGKRGTVKSRKDTPLNPLRAGEAIARQLVQRGETESESYPVIDAGRAPGLPKHAPRQTRPKKK